MLGDLGRNAEALPHLQQAIELDPALADAHHNLGMLLQSLKRHEEAVASLEQALRLAPQAPYTLSHLVWNEISVCRWAGLEAHIDALRSKVREGRVAAEPFVFVAVSPTPRSSGFAPRGTCARRRRRGRRCGRARAIATTASASRTFRPTFTSMPPRTWRRGCSSGTTGRVRPHRACPTAPTTAARCAAAWRGAFDRFIDVRSAQRRGSGAPLRELEVDIAVDLKGHTTGARPAILAFRPAPLQVSYLGYPGHHGRAVRRLPDRRPLRDARRRSGALPEQLVYLPDSYQVNDAARPIAPRTPSRAEAGLPENAFVFCCFNNSYKITPPVFASGCGCSRAVPGSVLWLLEDNAAREAQPAAGRAARGVAPARLVFAARLPPAEHLARHRLADLFLDTLPYNAHTTASDALWAGCRC